MTDNQPSTSAKSSVPDSNEVSVFNPRDISDGHIALDPVIKRHPVYYQKVVVVKASGSGNDPHKFNLHILRSSGRQHPLQDSLVLDSFRLPP